MFLTLLPGGSSSRRVSYPPRFMSSLSAIRTGFDSDDSELAALEAEDAELAALEATEAAEAAEDEGEPLA